MIEYDYVLERDYGTEKRVFRPSGIPTKLENIVYIEGPNSCGKSTLLNILALGFHGLKKERINPALRNKMNDLVSSKHQKLSFSFRVTHGNGSLVISSSKSDPSDREIIVKEIVDGKECVLAPETFHRKYNLLYDIPDNPTERLNQLVLEIKETQVTCSNRLGALRNYIVATINEIRHGRDPKVMEELRLSIGKTENELQKSREDLQRKEEQLDLIERYTYSRLYLSCIKDIESIENRIKELERRAKKQEQGKKKVNKALERQRETVRSLLESMEEKKREISSMIELFLQGNDRNHLHVWNRIDLQSSYQDFEIPEQLESEILAILRILTEMSRKDSSSGILAQASILSELINFLQRYRSSDVVLPGVGKTIDEFLSVLEEHYKKYKAVKTRFDNIQDTMNKLSELREDKRRANQELAKLREFKESQESGGQILETEDLVDQNEITKLNNKLNSIKQNADVYKAEMRKKGVMEEDISEYLNQIESNSAIEPYRVYNGQQLKELVNTLRSETIAEHRLAESKEAQLKILKNELRRMEGQEPHRYEHRLNDLEAILQRVQKLENILGKQFGQYINLVVTKKQGTTPSEKRYLKEVSTYLGRKVGFIRHIEDEYKVKEIDLVAGDIVTDSGKRIRLTDMGTGQSQSAYLSGLLNTEDNRPIIALFDEVAMMDETSLEPVYKKFRELYKQNRLLVGIVVQKAESIKVVPKG
ncbi:MAG: hypothetical protein QXU73_00700 [Thermoplasmata archaeon]